MRGPVGAAMKSLLRIGAAWPKPFLIVALGEEISLLEVPPKQVAEILKAQARKAYDQKLIEGILEEEGLQEQDAAAVRHLYKEGVDWELLRQILRNKRFELTIGERDALHTLVVKKFWSSKRLWLAGLLGHGSCKACLAEIADHEHVFFLCGAWRQRMDRLKWQGVSGKEFLGKLAAPPVALRPLLVQGLPPKRRAWKPVRAEATSRQTWRCLSLATALGLARARGQARLALLLGRW